jgi:hypothetical protein
MLKIVIILFKGEICFFVSRPNDWCSTFMPPVAQIYRPVRDLYEEAKSAKNRGDYSECVSKTELALKYSKPYGNRQ